MILQELLEGFLELEQEPEEQDVPETQEKLLVRVQKFMMLQAQLGLDGDQPRLTLIK